MEAVSDFRDIAQMESIAIEKLRNFNRYYWFLFVISTDIKNYLIKDKQPFYLRTYYLLLQIPLLTLFTYYQSRISSTLMSFEVQFTACLLLQIHPGKYICDVWRIWNLFGYGKLQLYDLWIKVVEGTERQGAFLLELQLSNRNYLR